MSGTHFSCMKYGMFGVPYFSSWCACFQWRYGLLCISHAYICNWLSYMQCGILGIAYILFHSHDKGFVIREMGTFADFSHGKQATEYVRACMEYPYFRYKLWVQPWCMKYAIVYISSGDILPQIVFYEIQIPYITNTENRHWVFSLWQARCYVSHVNSWG